jgi:hypothetical protein
VLGSKVFFEKKNVEYSTSASFVCHAEGSPENNLNSLKQLCVN